jgi:hypothetical protein
LLYAVYRDIDVWCVAVAVFQAVLMCAFRFCCENGKDGAKQRERETDDEIKAGKQQKLNIGTLFRQNQGSSSVSSPSSPSTASEVSPDD